MDSGYYAAMTGLMARTQALDTAAANLANAQTPGFRTEREYFRSVFLGPDGTNSQLGRTVNDYGLLGGDLLNQRQGPIQQTGNMLDVAIEGEGFFQIQTSAGMRYTRAGEFHRTSQGLMVNVDGDPVLSTTGQQITLPPGQVSIGTNGLISVAGATVAIVGVWTFAGGTQMKPEGINHLIAPSDATPVLSKNAALHQGAIEAANQDVIQSTLDVIMMQRQAEMMQRALTVFHTEFNKIASEDTPKV